MSLSFKILIILAAGFAAAAVFGGAAGDEAMLAVGLSGAFLCLVLMPAFAVRSARKKKILKRQDALVCFEYSASEAEEIAAAARPAVRRQSIKLSVLFSICLAVIFAPFVALSMQPEPQLPPMLPVAAVCVALPWLSVLLAPAFTARTIRNVPCVSVVGRNCILIANRYLGINDRYALEADAVRFEPGKYGGMAKLYVRYRFRAGRVSMTILRWVEAPVPRGREAEAAAIRV